jgi:hypothetical protein
MILIERRRTVQWTGLGDYIVKIRMTDFVSNLTLHDAPNDPKPSSANRGARRGNCMMGGKAAVEAGAVTGGGGSMLRMVR